MLCIVLTVPPRIADMCLADALVSITPLVIFLTVTFA